jgi:large subunit ribosomal protein L30
MPGKLRVTLVKSPISHNPANRATVKALGLHRIGETVEINDTPAVRGMIRTVRFLVRSEEADAGTTKEKATS